MVEIKINRVFQRDENLEAQLNAAFPRCKSKVVILPSKLTYAETQLSLASFAAEEIHEQLKYGMIVGLTMGTTLRAVVDSLIKLPPVKITVLQLCGSTGATDTNIDAMIIDSISPVFKTGVTLNEYLRIPHKDCIATGEHKATILSLAMRHGYINQLFTDRQTALSVLSRVE